MTKLLNTLLNTALARKISSMLFVDRFPLTRAIPRGVKIAFGYTLAGDYIACVYEWIDRDTLEPITAFLTPE